MDKPEALSAALLMAEPDAMFAEVARFRKDGFRAFKIGWGPFGRRNDFGLDEAIVAAAIEEDVDVVGLSILSGAHATLLPKVVAGLRAAGANDVLVVAGGIIPEEDRADLLSAGIAAVFGPGSTIAEIAAYLRSHVRSA